MGDQPWEESVRALRLQVEDIAAQLAPIDTVSPIRTDTYMYDKPLRGSNGYVQTETRRIYYDGNLGQVMTIDEDPGVYVTAPRGTLCETDIANATESDCRDYAAALLSAARAVRTRAAMQVQEES